MPIRDPLSASCSRTRVPCWCVPSAKRPATDDALVVGDQVFGELDAGRMDGRALHHDRADAAANPFEIVRAMALADAAVLREHRLVRGERHAIRKVQTSVVERADEGQPRGCLTVLAPTEVLYHHKWRQDGGAVKGVEVGPSCELCRAWRRRNTTSS